MIKVLMLTDLFLNIGISIISLLCGWLIAHIYYVKGNKLKKAEYDKFRKILSSDVRDILLDSNGKNLSVQDLIALLKARVKDDMDTDFLGYKVCPKCESADLNNNPHVEVDYDVGDAGELVNSPIFIPMVTCESCGWSKRIDEHDLLD